MNDDIRQAVQRITIKHMRGRHNQMTHANRGLSAGNLSSAELDKSIDVLVRDIAVVTGSRDSIKIKANYSADFVNALKGAVLPNERRWEQADKSWSVSNSNPKSNAVGKAMYVVQEHCSLVDARGMTESQKKTAIFNAHINRIAAGKKIAEANPNILSELRSRKAAIQNKILQMGRANNDSSFEERRSLGMASRRLEMAISGITQPESFFRTWQNTIKENDIGAVSNLMKVYLLENG